MQQRIRFSLKTNAWLPCPENDGCGENVWVGSDGAMVTDGIVKTADEIRYLVARNGHRVKNQTMTVGDMVYTTDEEGRITASHFNLATPSNAAEALPRQISHRKCGHYEPGREGTGG